MATRGDDGRKEMFAGMYERHYARMVRYLRGYRIPPDDARDLAQEVFVRFYQRLEQYRGEAEWGFLEKIARNLLINWWRDRSALKRSAPTLALDDPQVRQEPVKVDVSPEERLQTERNLQAIYDAIPSLSPGQQQALRLWLEGFKFEEIAEILRTTLDAVRSRLRDARKTLRARVGDKTGGILPEDES